MKKRKSLERLLSGSKNVRFSDAVACAEGCGFRLERISGSHHIYTHPAVPVLVNLQDVRGKAKPYQVKQLLQVIEKYGLARDPEDER